MSPGTMNKSIRHSNDRADSRANGVEMAAKVESLTHALHVNALRLTNPTRVSAGLCKSCDGPIDSNTGECRCSS